jgi:hypothetical protein
MEKNMRRKRKNAKRLLKKNEDDEDRPTEVLSQAEIEQLLTAITSTETDNSKKGLSQEEIDRAEKASQKQFNKLMLDIMKNVLNDPELVAIEASAGAEDSKEVVSREDIKQLITVLETSDK